MLGNISQSSKQVSSRQHNSSLAPDELTPRGSASKLASEMSKRDCFIGCIPTPFRPKKTNVIYTPSEAFLGRSSQFEQPSPIEQSLAASKLLQSDRPAINNSVKNEHIIKEENRLPSFDEETKIRCDFATWRMKERVNKKNLDTAVTIAQNRLTEGESVAKIEIVCHLDDHESKFLTAQRYRIHLDDNGLAGIPLKMKFEMENNALYLSPIP